MPVNFPNAVSSVSTYRPLAVATPTQSVPLGSPTVATVNGAASRSFIDSLFGASAQPATAAVETSASWTRGFSGIVSGVVDNLVSKAGNWVSKLFGGGSHKTEAPAAPGVPSSAAPAGCVVASAAPGATGNDFAALFDAKVGEVLRPDGDGRVHEEELFAAISYERIASLAGDAAASAFLQALQGRMQSMAGLDGSVPIEDAAKAALQDLAASGVIDPALADRIYSEAFAAAQLDQVTDLLYDDRGGGDDRTVATATFADALALARDRIARYEAGVEAPPARSLADAAAGPTARSV